MRKQNHTDILSGTAIHNAINFSLASGEGGRSLFLPGSTPEHGQRECRTQGSPRSACRREPPQGHHNFLGKGGL